MGVNNSSFSRRKSFWEMTFFQLDTVSIRGLSTEADRKFCEKDWLFKVYFIKTFFKLGSSALESFLYLLCRRRKVRRASCINIPCSSLVYNAAINCIRHIHLWKAARTAKRVVLWGTWMACSYIVTTNVIQKPRVSFQPISACVTKYFIPGSLAPRSLNISFGVRFPLFGFKKCQKVWIGGNSWGMNDRHCSRPRLWFRDSHFKFHSSISIWSSILEFQRKYARMLVRRSTVLFSPKIEILEFVCTISDACKEYL